MFKIGDFIVYGCDGVFEIVGIESKCFAGMNQENDYYILKSKENNNNKLFVPTNNEILCSKIKKILKYEEISALIKKNDTIVNWISDNKLRSKYYKEVINSYDREAMVALVKYLYEIKNNKQGLTKRLYSIDEDALKKMSFALFSELSHIIKILPEQVIPLICGEIDYIEKK